MGSGILHFWNASSYSLETFCASKSDSSATLSLGHIHLGTILCISSAVTDHLFITGDA